MRFSGILGVCFAVLFPCFSYSASSDAAVIATLKRQNENLSSLVCEFTQETRIPLFDSPVTSQGRMLFKRPDALLWEYVSPMCEGFAIKGSAGVRWRDNRKNTKPFSVSTDIVGAIIASQLIIWVSLDFERIEKEYALTVFESSPPILLLTPKRKDVAEVIKNLVIAFTVEGVASSVTITEQQGGVTVIRFTNVRVNGLIPDEEFQ